MSAQREELHHLVDQLPEEQVAHVLALVRENSVPSRQAQAIATLELVQKRMSGVTGSTELIKAKDVRPIQSVDDLAADGVFESDEELDEFLAFTHAARSSALA